jgi:hypothetical protein
MSDLKLFEIWCRQCGNYQSLEALTRYRTFQTCEEFTAWLKEKADDKNHDNAG